MKDQPACSHALPCFNVVRLEIAFPNGAASRIVQMPILPVGSYVKIDSGDPYSIKRWRFDVQSGETVCELGFVGDWDYSTEEDTPEIREVLADAGFVFDH